jgi:tetratricopeptide (TPR) repeat protein
VLDDWESRLAAVWETLDDVDEQQFLVAIERLASELPEGSPVAAFERASSLDSTGNAELAIPLYEQALDAGLGGERRRRAVIQLASALRARGDARESARLLEAELDRPSDHLDDAVRAFLALALLDLGRPRDAASLALTSLAPHLHRYQRSLAGYALLVEDDPGP